MTQIVWENRLTDDIGNDCLVAVDCADVKCPNWGPTFSTHKHGKKGGLRCELAHCLRTGDIVWINGPCPAGKFNDITIFRSCLLTFLGEDERVEVDDGHVGEAPLHCKCPKSFANPEMTLHMQSRVRSRQETINKRAKDFNVLQSIYRNDPTDHPFVFRACVVLKQLSINNGEKLFEAGYRDPGNHIGGNGYNDNDNMDGSDSDGSLQERSRQQAASMLIQQLCITIYDISINVLALACVASRTA